MCKAATLPYPATGSKLTKELVCYLSGSTVLKLSSPPSHHCCGLDPWEHHTGFSAVLSLHCGCTWWELPKWVQWRCLWFSLGHVNGHIWSYKQRLWDLGRLNINTRRLEWRMCKEWNIPKPANDCGGVTPTIITANWRESQAMKSLLRKLKNVDLQDSPNYLWQFLQKNFGQLWKNNLFLEKSWYYWKWIALNDYSAI